MLLFIDQNETAAFFLYLDGVNNYFRLQMGWRGVGNRTHRNQLTYTGCDNLTMIIGRRFRMHCDRQVVNSKEKTSRAKIKYHFTRPAALKAHTASFVSPYEILWPFFSLQGTNTDKSCV